MSRLPPLEPLPCERGPNRRQWLWLILTIAPVLAILVYLGSKS